MQQNWLNPQVAKTEIKAEAEKKVITKLKAPIEEIAHRKVESKRKVEEEAEVHCETESKGSKSNKAKPKQKLSNKRTKKVTINNVALTKIPFEELPGWQETDVKKSLLAFQNSCMIFLKQSPSHKVGSRLIRLQAKDWQPACAEAIQIDLITESLAREFFKKWFHPIELTQKKPIQGLFTGYYMPQLKGSLTRSKEFNTPIYGMPFNKKRNRKKNRRYYTREQIDNGALKSKAAVVAWINSRVKRLFLEIEGSGVIKLPSGKNLYIGYAGENGAPYTSISKLLINKGIMSRDNASKTALFRYLEKNPKRANSLIHKNKSFVFFEDLKKPAAFGAQGMPLTPGYSLAIDKKWIPLGLPLWLDTKKPQESEKDKNFHRLVIAQDTGGAIRGLMRGDIYWGSGKQAAFLGENMKNKGRFWLLLPKHIFERLSKMG